MFLAIVITGLLPPSPRWTWRLIRNAHVPINLGLRHRKLRHYVITDVSSHSHMSLVELLIGSFDKVPTSLPCKLFRRLVTSQSIESFIINAHVDLLFCTFMKIDAPFH